MDVLSAEGYGIVRPAGRERLKGHNRAGGWDAEADRTGGVLGRLHCIIQAKQYDTLAVHQRAVDELRGSCLRAEAHRAVLVTLSTFSAVARSAASADTYFIPIRLIDGDELLDMLIDKGIGVWGEVNGSWRLDEAYFDFLNQRFDTTVETPVSATSQRRVKLVGGNNVPVVTLTLTLQGLAGKTVKPERL